MVVVVDGALVVVVVGVMVVVVEGMVVEVVLDDCGAKFNSFLSPLHMMGMVSKN